MKPEYQCHNSKCGNMIVYCGEEYKDTLCCRCGWLRVEYHSKCCRVDKIWNFKEMKYEHITCTKDATHEVPFGEFGAAPLCDKHYAEHDPDEFSRVR